MTKIIIVVMNVVNHNTGIQIKEKIIAIPLPPG